VKYVNKNITIIYFSRTKRTQHSAHIYVTATEDYFPSITIIIQTLINDHNTMSLLLTSNILTT